MSRTATLVGFAALAIACVVVQVAGLARGRPPTLGALLPWLMRRRWVQCLLLAGWLWLGWHLFVRADHG